MKIALHAKAPFLAVIIVFITILISDPPALSMRIDGEFEDWKDVKELASDPAGDAKGAFDITRLYAASRGSTLYLRFDTGSVVNLQNGPKSEGTLLVAIDLPDDRRLILDTRGRRAYLNDDLKERISWDRLKYIVGPTYAQDEFEIQIDLDLFDINPGDSIHIQFDGSDRLDSPAAYTFSEPSIKSVQRSPRRHPGTDVRVASFNTYFEGLSDPARAGAIGRLLNSVDADIYCFQEEWKSTGIDEIMSRLMPLENDGRWYVHKVSGTVIASKHPLEVLASSNSRHAVARIELEGKPLIVICVHLSAMGYIGSKEDISRIGQAKAIMETIEAINKARDGQRDSLASKAGIIIVGDFNLVGSRTPLDSMINNKDTILKDWMLPNLAGESIITWRGGPKASFAPGKLDYLLYTPETLKPENGFLLDSQLLNQAALNRLKLNAADSKASDHLLMAFDFQLLY